MKKNRKIYLLMAIILVAHYFFVGCGAKTKSSNETEVKEKTLSEAEITQKTKELDSIKVALEEEYRKKYSDTNSTSSKKEATRTTTIDVTETVQKPTAKNPEDFRPAPNGKFINDATGEIINRHTRTVIEEKFNEEMLRQQEIKIEEEEKKKKDSIATFEKVNEIIDKKLELKDLKDFQRINNLKKEGWKPSLWFVIGIILFLLA
jgi:preprotein translocase subunit SecF